MCAGMQIAAMKIAAGVLLLVWLPGGMAATLFEDESALTIVLEGPWSQTLSDNDDEPVYLPYTLTADGVEMDVDVRPRGASRRLVCEVPPLRLNFKNASPPSVFAGQGKLKLVTHCNTTKKAEQNVLEEYAAYRILNLISDASFGVRLLKITYKNSERPQRQPPTKWGFVIEDVEKLAKPPGWCSCGATLRA
jgi:hypothetical protein